MSDRDAWNDAQHDAPTPMKKKGMSGCMLAALIVGGVGGVGLLVCCGGLAWFGSMFVPKIVNSPAEVTEVGHQILNTEMLDGFVPDKAVTMDNMIFTLRFAEYRHKEGKGEMMIGNMKLKMGDPNQAKMQSTQFKQPFEEKMKSLDVKKTETHEVTINGQKVNVAVGEATDKSSGKGVHTVNLEFDQGGVTTFLLMQLDDDLWDQDAFFKWLEETKMP